MKKLLFIILTFASLSAFGQAGSLSQSVYRSRVNDSTTVNGSHSAGYGDFFWNNQASTPGWRVWNGTSYDIGFSSGGSFWPLAGSATLTGNVDIDGAVTLNFGNNTQLTEFYVTTLTSSSFTSSGFVGLDAPEVNLNSSNEITLTASDSINLTAPIIKLGGQVGTEGQSPIINSSGKLKYANPHSNTSTALTDASTITITGLKHTLTSDEATVTWTLSQTSDFQTTDIILNATSTTWTFPANALCVVDGVASGTNTAALTGVSGDHHIMSIYKDGTNYRVVIKNFGQ